MRVLIVNESKPERDMLCRQLGAVHEVDAVDDMRAAVSSLEECELDVVVLSCPRTGSEDAVRRVRSCDRDRHPYLILVADKQPLKEIAALMAAGADDFLRRPLNSEELALRVDAPERIGKWAKFHTDDKPKFDLRKARAYGGMGEIVAEDLSGLFSEPLETSEGRVSKLPLLRGASMSLGLASEQTELVLNVAVSDCSLAALGKQLLGESNADSAALDDMLRELVNTAGGAVKRACLDESITLTTGLPQNQILDPRTRKESQVWVTTTQQAGVKIFVWGEVLTLETRHVRATELTEGMILAKDVHQGSGVLLAPAGTRLTATTAARLANALGSKSVPIASSRST